MSRGLRLVLNVEVACCNVHVLQRAIIINNCHLCLSSRLCHQPRRRSFSISTATHHADSSPGLAEPRTSQYHVNTRDPSLYPLFPRSLWKQDTQSVHNGLRTICRRLNLPIQITNQHSTTRTKLRSCKLGVQIGDKIGREATAKGESKSQALNKATANLLAKFHDTGVLSDLYKALEESSLLEPIIRDSAEKFVEAKSEVYNLCARLGLVPQFNYIARKAHPLRAVEAPVVQASIVVPELGINLYKISEDAATAGIATCLAARTIIHDLMAKPKFAASFPNQVTGLTVDTAPDFHNFYAQAMIMAMGRRVSINLSHEYDFQRISGLVHTTIHMGQSVCKATVVSMSKVSAEKFANLVAAVQLAKENPHIVFPFQQSLEQQRREVSQRRLRVPFKVELGSEILGIMENATTAAWDRGMNRFGGRVISASTETDTRSFDRSRLASGPLKNYINKDMEKRLRTLRTASEFEDMRQHRTSLPMSEYRADVLRLVQDPKTPFSIVVGATGSGKSTQVPQLLLDDAIERGVGADCNIICTQPRRIAATSVARRVASERGEPLGQSVGYHVRFDAMLPRPNGSITFCTTGVLLAQLKADADGVLNYASHILIDEVHERDLPVDVLMAMIKKAVATRQARGLPVPKVVLMSATMNTALFSNYFGSSLEPAPSISVPGRTFAVQTRFLNEIMSDLNKNHHADVERLLQRDTQLKDYLDNEINGKGGIAIASGANQPSDPTNRIDTPVDSTNDESVAAKQEDFVPVGLVASVIARIAETTQEGAILAFLPGLKDILETQKALIRDDMFKLGFGDASKYRIYLLHSSIPRDKQAAVFDAAPPGCRKIILSTNIAETSVTVPDVQHVIDTGKLREKRYDQLTQISALQCVWESKSNSMQRSGRAGRVQNGFYYALFSRERYDQMAITTLPEIRRSDLQETCLAIKKQHYHQNIAAVLTEFIEPPPAAAVTAAVQHLIRLKALTDAEELTPLGLLLVNLPIHPALGKMIVMGIIFRCLDPLLILAAAADGSSLFYSPLNERAQARASHGEFGGHNSDHLSMLQAYDKLRSHREEYGKHSAKDVAANSFLRWEVFCTIEKSALSILDVLIKSGLVPAGDHDTFSKLHYGHPSLNTNSTNKELVRTLLVSGLYPNMAINSGTNIFFRSKDGGSVLIHPSSENSDTLSKKPIQGQPSWERTTFMVFNELERQAGSDMLWARDTTIVHPLTTVLFANDEIRSGYDGSTITMRGWPPFTVKKAREDADGPVLFKSRTSTVNYLLRFRTLLDTMFDRACGDLSKLQQLHQNSVSSSPLSSSSRRTSSYSSPRSFADDFLQQTLVDAIVDIVDKMPPVVALETTAPESSITIKTNRVPRRIRPQDSISFGGPETSGNLPSWSMYIR